MILSIDIQHKQCPYTECHNYINVMLSVVMLNVINLNAVRLNVDMLSVVRLNVDMLSVVRLNVVMLSVVALQSKLVPFENTACHETYMQRTDGTAYFVGAIG
jgi:hypothetical protein